MPFGLFLENNSVNLIVIITDLQNLQFFFYKSTLSSIIKLKFIFFSHPLCVFEMKEARDAFIFESFPKTLTNKCPKISSTFSHQK